MTASDLKNSDKNLNSTVSRRNSFLNLNFYTNFSTNRTNFFRRQKKEPSFQPNLQQQTLNSSKFVFKNVLRAVSSSPSHKNTSHSTTNMNKIDNKDNSSLINNNHNKREMKLGSLVRAKLYNSFPNLHNINNALLFRKDSSSGFNNKISNDGNDENILKVLKAVASDHVVTTSSADNKIRRSVFLERSENEKFGFTLQSYSFRRRSKNNQVERITYVDYVALGSPAFNAGLRAGDVILAINGKNIQNYGHKNLVQYIIERTSLRMVVLFENCVNRIDLCSKAVKLKKLLSDKIFELKILEIQEERLMKGLPLLTDDEILMALRTPATTPSPTATVSIVTTLGGETANNQEIDESSSQILNEDDSFDPTTFNCYSDSSNFYSDSNSIASSNVYSIENVKLEEKIDKAIVAPPIEEENLAQKSTEICLNGDGTVKFRVGTGSETNSSSSCSNFSVKNVQNSDKNVQNCVKNVENCDKNIAAQASTNQKQASTLSTNHVQASDTPTNQNQAFDSPPNQNQASDLPTNQNQVSDAQTNQNQPISGEERSCVEQSIEKTGEDCLVQSDCRAAIESRDQNKSESNEDLRVVLRL